MEMMKRAVVCALLAIGWGMAHVVPAEAMTELVEQGETNTVIGEIVDLSSYLRAGPRASKVHAQTPEAAERGGPLAFLEQNGRLCVLLAGESGKDPAKLVARYLHQKVAVSGKIYTRGGMKGIEVLSIEPAGRPEAAPANQPAH